MLSPCIGCFVKIWLLRAATWSESMMSRCATLSIMQSNDSLSFSLVSPTCMHLSIHMDAYGSFSSWKPKLSFTGELGRKPSQQHSGFEATNKKAYKGEEGVPYHARSIAEAPRRSWPWKGEVFLIPVRSLIWRRRGLRWRMSLEDLDVPTPPKSLWSALLAMIPVRPYIAWRHMFRIKQIATLILPNKMVPLCFP